MESSSKNAVVAIRISSVKQGLQGDSPEDQKQQIERFAAARNIKIKKFFIFMESASKEEQPVQEAIDYCKSEDNDIQLFIIKSIDRFTRGGSYLYDHLKRQLDRYNVSLIDIYGVIGSKQVNTLEHLGLEYDWSVYSPTKKAEILEAERAKDEMRDIMTRMIGAEIRYVRMGYRVRQPPFGYQNVKVETSHGKRVILEPQPEEARWIKRIFKLRIQGTMNDQEIVDHLNSLGYKSRKQYVRDPKDRTKIIGQRGERPLRLKQMWRYIKNPIYAGINNEKWTEGNPVKGNFKGLVSIDSFNKANRGKIIIAEENGRIVIHKSKPPDHLVNKKIKNPKFPYKRFVACPQCNKPLYGSASRGKSGKYYPAYHCNKRGHYFRVPNKEFNETIENFISSLHFSKERVEELCQHVMEIWNDRQESQEVDSEKTEKKIQKLESTARAVGEKIKFLTSETAIKYVEEEIIEIEKEIKNLKQTQSKQVDKEVNMKIVTAFAQYYLEHLGELLFNCDRPLKSAEYFGLLFDKRPTYEELVSGTPKLVNFLEVDRVKKADMPILPPKCDPTGNRIPVTWMRTMCPNH